MKEQEVSPILNPKFLQMDWRDGNKNWVYIKSEPGLWTVGFYAPDGVWHSDSDHDSKSSAAERVHYLNGGKVSMLTLSKWYPDNNHDSRESAAGNRVELKIKKETK